MDNIVFLPAYELANLIRGGEIFSREVIEAYLHHIFLYNPSLNAIVTLDTKNVFQQAEKADQALARGEVWGSLHGVPITIKDSLETQGMRTTCSYEPLANYIPKKDATVVARLRQAGAIILGKTNTPKLTGDFQTNSPLFGRTNNPWNLNYTPGGSTGGGAAAIAGGLSPLEIGSDLGGSIRVPAHFCGIFGLKPTENRVSTWGHIPELPGHPKTIKHLQTVGPLARSIEDLRLCLSIIEGVDIQQEWVTEFSEKIDPIKSLKYYRFAWTKGFGKIPSCADTQSALEKLALSLTKLECYVKNAQPSGIDFNETWEVYQSILAYEFRVDPQWDQFQKYQFALEQRQIIIRQIELFFHHWDVWLTPVVPIPAFPHCTFGSEMEIEGKKYRYFEAIGAYTTLFNLTGHPVVVLPLSQSSQGLPIGVQLVGKRGNDQKLLAIAHQLSKIIDILSCPLNY